MTSTPKKYRCFVICPIGAPGTETRQFADDLLELIINPAFETLDFEATRGDHQSEPNRIDEDVIRRIKEANLCIVDISVPNPNVYYELGHCDAIGKDCILLKRKDSTDDLPVDIGTRRYIEYDLDNSRSNRTTIKAIRESVEQMLTRGFADNASDLSLEQLAEKIDKIDPHAASTFQTDVLAALTRVEHRLELLTANSKSEPVKPPAADPFADNDPREVFTLAARQRNLPLLERALDQLAPSMDKLSFLDYYVEVAAGRGLAKAGQMLIDNAVEFMDSTMSFRKKIEYLGSLVGFLNRTDRELEQQELVERICDTLWALREGADPKDIAQIFNQRNRLYHGIYGLTDDPQWLNMAIRYLKQAHEYAGDESYIFFNLAMCYRAADDLPNAKVNVLRAIEIDADKPDVDHLQIACKILRKLDDPGYPAMLERLRAVSPLKADLIETAKS